MGFDPDSDKDIIILNGRFFTADDWNVANPFSIAGGVARYRGNTGGVGNINQAGVTFLPGNIYEISWIQSNNIFPNPARGIIVSLDSSTDGIIYNVGGTKTATIFAATGNEVFSFSINVIDAADQCDIDIVTITRIGEYSDEVLQIFYPDPKVKDSFAGVLSDRWEQLGSQNGKTGLLLAYNFT